MIVVGMIITGTANTLLNKLQDRVCIENCDNPAESKFFEQPVWQTLNMFIGEMLCLLVHFLIQFCSNCRSNNLLHSEPLLKNYEDNLSDSEDFPLVNEPKATSTKKPMVWTSYLLIWLMATLDIISTTLMNVGLLNIAASVYQMLRGSVVLFTGLMSVVFLRTRYSLTQLSALLLVSLGVVIVGASPILFPNNTSIDEESQDEEEATMKVLLGVGLVLSAQLFSAFQFTLEESFITRRVISPLKMVGFEGLFGFLSAASGLLIAHFSFGHGTNGFFDAAAGLHQILNNTILLSSSIGCALSIAFFNWFGLQITKRISATSRTTIDTTRTMFIWMISLAIGWEYFIWLQVIGFLVLIFGTFAFNKIIGLSNIMGCAGITRILFDIICIRRR